MNKTASRHYRLDQTRAPIYEALTEFKRRRIVSFDVPGHKQGRGNEELTALLGKSCLSVDVSSLKMLQSRIHPTGVIDEAQKLASDA